MNTNFFYHTDAKTKILRYLVGAVLLVFVSWSISLCYVITLDRIQRKSFALIDYLEKKFDIEIEYESYRYGIGSITLNQLKIDGSVSAELDKAEIKIRIDQLFSNKNSLLTLDLIHIGKGQIEIKDKFLQKFFETKEEKQIESFEHNNSKPTTTHLLSVLQIDELDVQWLYSNKLLTLSKLKTLRSSSNVKDFLCKEIQWNEQSIYRDIQLSLTQKQNTSNHKPIYEIKLKNLESKETEATLNLTTTFDPAEKKMNLSADLNQLPKALSDLIKIIPEPDQSSSPYKIQISSVVQATSNAWGGVFEIKTHNLPISEAKIHSTRFHVNSRSKFRIFWDNTQNFFNIENGFIELGLNKQKFWFSGSYDKNKQYVKLQFNLPSSSCEQFKNSLPSEWLTNLSDFELSGKIATSLDVGIPLNQPELFSINQLTTKFECKTKSVPYKFSHDRLAGDFQYENKYRKESPRFTMGSSVATPNYSPLKHIPDHLVQSLVALEDKNFLKHHGFDWTSIEAAIRSNLKTNQFKVGASTITMQLAKNLFLDRSKNLSRKIQEAFLTWHLENILNKDRILEIYLNYVEFAPNIFGINQGAQYYFAKTPSTLSAEESLFLTLALPSPGDHLQNICRPQESRKKIFDMNQHYRKIFGKLPDSKKIDKTISTAKTQCNKDLALDIDHNKLLEHRR